MIGLLPILGRWKLGLGIAGALAFLGLALAANHYRHAYYAEKTLRKADRSAYETAQAQASERAQAALISAEHKYKEKAYEAQQSYQATLADMSELAGTYKSRNRMWNQTSEGPSSRPTAGTEDNDSGLHQESSPPSIVVAEADFDRCTAWVAYGEEAYDWALTLEK